MERRRVFRGLRIAWSVVFGLLNILAILMWVRSYWSFDRVS
jgi:hypothetical protein